MFPSSEKILLLSFFALSISLFTVFLLKSLSSSCYVRGFKENCEPEANELVTKEKLEVETLQAAVREKELLLTSIDCSELVQKKNNNETAESQDQDGYIDDSIASEPIDVPAWEKGEIAALNGCWLLDSDYELQNENTGKLEGVASWSMCFQNNSDLGIQNITYENGRNCLGQPVKRRFDLSNDSTFELLLDDTSDVLCDGNFLIYHRIYTCRVEESGDFALCSGRQLRDGIWHDSYEKVYLRRKGEQ